MKFTVNQWKFYRGQDEQILVHLLDEAGEPINISGASAIKIRVAKQDGTILEKDAYTGIAAGLGCCLWIYAFQFSAAETALLPLGVSLVEVKVLFNNLIHVFPYKSSLTVLDPPIATT